MFVSQRPNRSIAQRPPLRPVLRRTRAHVLSREDGGPVVLDADDRPTFGVGLLEGLLGTAGVVELAVGVVVEQEQGEEWAVLMPREFEHRNVAVGVACGEQWPAA